MDEEESSKGVGGKPNAYFAKVRAEMADTLSEDEKDNFTASFRGAGHSIRRGQQTVTAEDMLGSDTDCWCGLPTGHSWPGKDQGTPHPKESDMAISQLLNRSNLTAYSRPLQDFVMTMVEKYELTYRVKNNGVILYPPDGSQPVTVHARSSERQVKQLEAWFHKHVEPARDQPVADASKAAVALAEKLNGTEHSAEEVRRRAAEQEANRRRAEEAYQGEQVRQAIAAKKAIPTPPAKKVTVRTATAKKTTAPARHDWAPWASKAGDVSPHYETDGLQFRCTHCHEQGIEVITDTRPQAHGHFIGNHTEDLAVKTERITNAGINTSGGASMAARRSAIRHMQAAMEEIAAAYPSWVAPRKTTDTTALEQRITDLETERDAALKRAEEMEAKLALLREAVGLVDS